jgi:hypothetical protein
MSVTVDLAVLETAVAEAKQREQAAHTALQDVPRQAARDQAPLTAYYERVGAGESEDLELEQRLKAELAAKQQGLTVTAEKIPYGAGAFDIRMVVSDEAAEARHRGAVAARKAAEASLREFVERNIGRLMAEDLPAAQATAAEGTEVLQAAHRLLAQWEARRAQHARLAVLIGRESLLGTIPANPFAWAADSPREAPLCMPEAFIP